MIQSKMESYQPSSIMADKMLKEGSPMEVPHSAPSLGPVEVKSEDESSSTTTDAGDSNTEDLNTSQLLGDDEVVGDRTEEDIASIPINHVLIKIMDQSFEITA